MSVKQKIEIELDQELKTRIDIISKAFGITPEKFIVLAITHETWYIKTHLDYSDIENELEVYQKTDMFEISYVIHIERKESPNDIIELLKKHNIKFGIWKIKDFKIEFDEPYEELPLVTVEKELYNKLKKLSEITGIPVEDIASKELEDFFYSVGDIPVIFLDRYLGIENIENPIEMLEKMNKVIDIRNKHLNWLKTQDLVEHVKKWHNLLKKT